MATAKLALTFIFVVCAHYYADAITLPWVAAPAPSLDCTQMLYKLSDCIDFIKGGNTITKKCCSGVKNVIPSVSQECVCEAVALAGNSFNITRALTLPSLCHISATLPSIHSCSSSGPLPPSLQATSPDASPMQLSPSPSPLAGSAPPAAAMLSFFVCGVIAVGAAAVLCL